MADDPNVLLGLATALGSVGGYVLKALGAEKKKREEVQAKLREMGMDLIGEQRTELALARTERQRIQKENEQLREMAWRWRTEHTELAVENDLLRQQIADLKSRIVHLASDIERYRSELAKATVDIRPPDTEDITGPQQAVKRPR